MPVYGTARSTWKTGHESIEILKSADDVPDDDFFGRVGEAQAASTAAKSLDQALRLQTLSNLGQVIAGYAVTARDLVHRESLVVEELFYQTLRDSGAESRAVALVGGRARMIADSLLTGIAMHRDGIAGAKAGNDLPHV